MWFFDWFERYFGYVRSRFDSIANSIDGVPYLGAYLAYPFRVVASYFANLKTAASYASSWADGVYSSAWNVFCDTRYYFESRYSILTKSAWSRFGDIRSYMESTWSILTKSAWSRFLDIRSYMESSWSILTKSAWSRFSDIRSYMESTWSILTKSAWSRFWDIRSYIESSWSILTETKSTIWTWLETNRLGSYFDSKIQAAKNTIIGFVTGAFGYLTTEWFTFLDHQWDSFRTQFAWLLGKLVDLFDDKVVDKIIDIIDTRVDHFKDKIWALVEKLVEKI